MNAKNYRKAAEIISNDKSEEYSCNILENYFGKKYKQIYENTFRPFYKENVHAWFHSYNDTTNFRGGSEKGTLARSLLLLLMAELVEENNDAIQN